ncbi:SOS response-associated peptidase [Salegentibacter sp. F188]|uniref:Abasic site processing protein n=1 Tax=Autumnicola patrickiae TaxID=3075591 RepID=A0ABU3E060_9FLAO|nr:SOS response-associated peptidase [Salegentibacter sp. F188]MDT0689362.1 SOS response-associated peptidase [Salegentibacter sp. F188]
MCYETSLTKTTRQIEQRFSSTMKVPLLYEPYYHRSAYTYPNLFCIPQEDPSEIFPMEWGLVPFWVHDLEKHRNSKYKNWNAKKENVFTSKSFKGSIKNKRCLIIADGFFEPHYEPGVKGAIPKYCYLEERKLFTFAGIYTEIDSDYWTVGLITTEANDFFAEIHNRKKRMPLVLDEDFEGEWLNPSLNEKNVQELMDNGFTKEDFFAHTVRRDFYTRDANLNVPGTLEPVD